MSIIEKPWGHEEIIEINDVYMVKRLFMRAGHRCSLQYHEKKCETIVVLSGQLKIVSGASVQSLNEHIYQPQQFITIPPKVNHQWELGRLFLFRIIFSSIDGCHPFTRRLPKSLK